MDARVMLELQDVSFAYKGGRPALTAVHLTFERGGIVSLVGPNGSGKTTLLRCVNDLLHPDGRVLLRGRAVRSMSRRELARAVAYVPQSFTGDFPVTVFDMVLLGRRPHVGWSPSDRDLEVVARCIADLGLADFTLRDVGQLSGGERQQVLIARALAQEPEVLLLDEPTSNLDIRHQLNVMRYLCDIVSDRGLLALVAIHDLNLASQYSDDVVMMHQGHVYARGTSDQVLTRENIQIVYDVDVAIHRHGDLRHIVPVDQSSRRRLEVTTAL